MQSPTARLLTAALIAAAAVPSLALSTPRPLPTMTTPATATYGSMELPTKSALARGLSCNVISATVSCYATQAAALRAGRAATKHTNATCSPPMSLYNGTSFTGSFLNIYTQSVWVDLAGYGFSNVPSSWKTGCAGGYLADGYASGTMIGMPANNNAASMGSFDNKASSALRCPC